MLADKTHPQIRALDNTYQRKYGRTLVELLEGEKALKGNSESRARPGCRNEADALTAVDLALKGIAMGPLHYDVYLLTRALDGPARNDVSAVNERPTRKRTDP